MKIWMQSLGYATCFGWLLLGSGCVSRSPEVRLYVFASQEGWQAVASRPAVDQAVFVQMAPVRLAEYLDRPQIVTRITESEIRAHTAHRWGIPLDVAAQEVLAGAIARKMPTAHVTASSRLDESKAGYRVHVEIIRLDGIPGKRVELVAQWRVIPLSGDRQPVIEQLRVYATEGGNDLLEGYVESVRAVLVELGEDIATHLVTRGE